MLKPPADKDVAQARWLTGLGHDALQKNQYDKATGCFSRACDACPDDLRLRLNLAKAHRQGGQYNQAIGELNRVLDDANNRSEVLCELGDLYLLQGQLQPALKHADMAIEDNRNSPFAWELKGRVLAKMGNNRNAIDCFNRALTIENQSEYETLQVDHDRLRYHLAQSLIESGRLQKAATILDSISIRYPSNKQPEQLASMQGTLFLKMNMGGRAIETLQQAIQNPEASSLLHVQLSEVQQAAGDLSSAKITMANAQRKFPNDPSVQARTAQLQPINRDVVIR